MANQKRDNTCAQLSGMTIEQWKAAKSQVHNARTRGRKPARPVSSLTDPVSGQIELFPGGDDQ